MKSRGGIKRQKKVRSAYCLFAPNTPFRPKVVKKKKKYTRKVKHKSVE